MVQRSWNNRNEITPKKIVIVGGGFAGLNFLKHLANDKRYEIMLVDKNNYHFFPPLLYQVGMAFIEPSNICYPFRRFFQKRKNIRYYLGMLHKIHPESNCIETDTGSVYYDYLVLAMGTEPRYFGMENVKKNAWPLKTINDATNLRNHLLLNLEKAVRCNDTRERRRLLTVVIAGGGPTGVEVAGMLAEMVRTIGPKEYGGLLHEKFRIYLVQGAPALLKPMSEKAQREALRVLKNLHVNVLLDRRVTDYVNGKVVLDTRKNIPTNALLWTSGVIGREVRGFPVETYGAGRRIMVDAFNKVKGTSNIFAVGDICLHLEDARFPEGHPQLAQTAIQQGKHLAKNFKRIAAGENLQPFVYKDMGTMAIISKYKAVVDLPQLFFKGFGAWLLWLFVHLIPIAGYRNKFNLAMNWAWSFITNDPTLRLILRPQKKEFRDQSIEQNGHPTEKRKEMKKGDAITIHE